MALFRCTYSQGVGSGIPLVVTCTSGFAGLTITCSDGTTTLTGTCPSSSPYEVTFNLPNTGTWEVSGTISGVPYTEQVVVEEFDCELKNNIDLSIDFYSAANDTVSYIGAIDGETHTITTDNSGHASATITIMPNGSTITFTSSVAKDPSNLSNVYSKAITLTSNTTSVYFMPNDNAIYWYGYSNGVENVSTANGWSRSSYTFNQGTWSTNYFTTANGVQGNYISGFGTTQSKTCEKLCAIAQGLSGGTEIGYVSHTTNKSLAAADNTSELKFATSLAYKEKSVNFTGYIDAIAFGNSQARFYAVWYE